MTIELVAIGTMLLGFLKLWLDIASVHKLVNSRSKEQDAKIEELRSLLAAERKKTESDQTV